jgi:hypothetical protein
MAARFSTSTSSVSLRDKDKYSYILDHTLAETQSSHPTRHTVQQART